MLKWQEIHKKALEVLSMPEYVMGIRWASLIDVVSDELKENKNTCSGSLYSLPNEMPIRFQGLKRDCIY